MGKLDCSLPENLNAKVCRGSSDPKLCLFGYYFDKGIKACKKYVIYFGEWKDLVKITIKPDADRDPV